MTFGRGKWALACLIWLMNEECLSLLKQRKMMGGMESLFMFLGRLVLYGAGLCTARVFQLSPLHLAQHTCAAWKSESGEGHC